MNDPGVLIHTIKKLDEVIVPNTINSSIMHMNHYEKIRGHPGDDIFIAPSGKLTIGLRFHWPATEKYGIAQPVHKIGIKIETINPNEIVSGNGTANVHLNRSVEIINTHNKW